MNELRTVSEKTITHFKAWQSCFGQFTQIYAQFSWNFEQSSCAMPIRYKDTTVGKAETE